MLKWTKQQNQQQQSISFPLNATLLHKALTKKAHCHTQTHYNLTNFICNTTNSNNYSHGRPFEIQSIVKIFREHPLHLSAKRSVEKKMPTMTHVLERRRLQRYSLDNQLEVPSPRRICHSLTSAANKENFDVHFTRSSFGHTSLTAFQDLSNGKSPIRVEYTPTRAALRYQTQTPHNVPLNVKRRSGTPTTRNRFSDDFATTTEPVEDTPLSHLRFRSASRDNSLSSSRMGDVTLDRMLDAIIESARKDVQRVSAVRRMENGLPQTADSPVVVSDGEMSIHEMEVRTPTHLKRQRVVRRKNTKTTDTRRKVEAFEAVAAAQLTPPAPSPPQTQPLIGLTLPDGIPSPDTPLFKPSIASNIELLAMQTPPNATFIVDNNYVSSTAGGATNSAAELPQRCSTPTLVEEMPSIKRCLSFSSASDEEDDADFSNAAKRSSVASSNTSSTMGEHYCSGRASQNSYTKSAGPAAVRGNVELAINVERQQLNVHVIRCRDLQRPNGSTALNAYVKVALIRNEANSKPTENHFQRTAVHRHSSRPYFDHRFRFDLGAQQHVEPQAAGAAETVGDHLQLAVWHRDRQLKRSEFLGCMSFPLQTLLKQPVNGFYKLQSQACLLKPQPPILLPSTCVAAVQTQQSSAPTAHNSNQKTVTHYQIHTKPQPLQPPALVAAPAPPQPIVPESGRFVSVATATNAATAATMTSTLTRQKSDEDVMSIDSMAQATAGNNIEHPMTLSRKALHQRDADENLFLRFLELDPPTEASAPTTAANATPSSGRRLSSSSKAIGRTPFTMTKKLTRTAERGFGFSIVWTHPPRVEKIEPGLSADRAGIQPGDYVIFVDKQNVVTMPEADVLNLIRSQGSTLTLEVFRRTGPAAGGGGGGGGVSGGLALASMPSMPPALSVGSRGHPTAPVMNGKASSSTRLASAVSDEQQSVTGGPASTTQRRIAVASALPSAAVGTNAGSTMTVAVTSAVTNARPSTACSGGTTSSIEAAKRRLHLPQVTFSKEVGKGVIV